MLNDILIFALSLWGVIALLFTLVFKMLTWRMEEITFTIPLFKEDKEIYNKIYNIHSFCEFCGIQKKSTVILVNYDAPEWYINDIKSFYKQYDFLQIVSETQLTEKIKELHT